MGLVGLNGWDGLDWMHGMNAWDGIHGMGCMGWSVWEDCMGYMG